MNQQQASALIDEKLQEVYTLLKECENLAEAYSLTFSLAPELHGLQGNYEGSPPAPWNSSNCYPEDYGTNEGWNSSNC